MQANSQNAACFSNEVEVDFYSVSYPMEGVVTNAKAANNPLDANADDMDPILPGADSFVDFLSVDNLPLSGSRGFRGEVIVLLSSEFRRWRLGLNRFTWRGMFAEWCAADKSLYADLKRDRTRSKTLDIYRGAEDDD